MKTIFNTATLVIALLPTIVIMALVLGNARYKREPFKKVASVFGISALSTIPACILEWIGSLLLMLVFAVLGAELTERAALTAYEFLEYMLIVGMAEEACKYFTFKWMIFHDRDFDNTYDGIIYGAASALGFATLENLMYIFLDNDSQMQTAVIRAMLSVPLHAITGIVMGYWFGISKYRRYNNIQPETRPEHKAFLFSVAIHGAYDFIVTLPEIYSDSSAVNTGSMCVLIAVMLFIYVLMGRTIRRAKRETHNIYNRYYYEQLGGAMQDMIGGKTTEKRRFFFPFGRQPGFNPYNPYAGMNLAPVPAQQNASYVFGTQQPYNPYYQQPQQAPQQQWPSNGQQGAPAQQFRQQPIPVMQAAQNGQPVMNAPAGQPAAASIKVEETPQTVYGPPSVLGRSPLPGVGQQYGMNVPAPKPPEPPKIYCGNCGAPNKAGSKYCHMCGSKIVK